jgi:hypothetical protein
VELMPLDEILTVHALNARHRAVWAFAWVLDLPVTIAKEPIRKGPSEQPPRSSN